MKILNAEPDGYPEEAKHILSEFGHLTSYHCNRTELMKEIVDTDILITRLGNFLDAEILNKAKSLRVIVSATTGTNHIDLKLANLKKIQVLTLKGENEFLRSITATAEHTWCLLLSLLRNLVSASESVKSGYWSRDSYIGTQLSGKTIGIIGFGRLGRIIAEYGRAFRMKVLYFDPYIFEVNDLAEKVDFSTLLAISDVVTVHVSYSGLTHHLINYSAFNLMKPSAVLINTSRGEIINEAALLSSLEDGLIAGAAIDVLDNEVNIEAERLRYHPLVKFSQKSSNLIITPHIGGATSESMESVEIFMAQKTARYLQSLQLNPKR